MKRWRSRFGVVLAVATLVSVGLVVVGGSSSARTGSLSIRHRMGITPMVGRAFEQGQPATFHPQFPQPPLQNWGGRVLHTSSTYAIFWDPSGQLSASYRNLVDRYLHDVAADSGKSTNVFSILNQYGDSAGPITYSSSFAGSSVDTDSFPQGCQPGPGFSSCFTDGQLQSELDSYLGANGIARPDNRIFMVVLPQAVDTCLPDGECADNSFCGYHGVQPTGQGDLLYASLPYAARPGCDYNGRHPNGSTADPLINVMSHEQSETITDPDAELATYFGPPLSWADQYDQEVGDKCVGYLGVTKYNGVGDYNQVINGHDYLLQAEWSNALSGQDGLGCVMNGADRKPHANFLVATLGSTVTAVETSTSDPDKGDHVVAATSYWNFGDGTAYLGKATQAHHYAKTGTYTITLEYSDTAGATASVQHTVHVVNLFPAKPHPFTATFNATLDYQVLGVGSASGFGPAYLVGPYATYDGTNYPVSFGVSVIGAGIESTTDSNEQIELNYQLTVTDDASPPTGANYTVTGAFQITGGVGANYEASGSGSVTGHCTTTPTDPIAACSLTYAGTIGET